MTNDDLILKWMLDELKQEEIKEVTVKMLDRLVDKGTTMAKNKTFEILMFQIVIIQLNMIQFLASKVLLLLKKNDFVTGYMS